MLESGDDDVKRIGKELRRPVHFGETFDERVMADVRAMPRHRLRSWTRLIRRRTITVSPVLGALAATLIVAVAISTGHALGVARVRPAAIGIAASPSGTGQGSADGHRDVQFVLVAPTARKVTVVGDFNDWDSAHAAFQAEHRGGGVWSVTAPVPLGHHRYSFVVDDSVWVTDPSAPRALGNDFGVPSSALVVGGDAGR
jgi:hypothetical protein